MISPQNTDPVPQDGVTFSDLSTQYQGPQGVPDMPPPSQETIVVPPQSGYEPAPAAPSDATTVVPPAGQFVPPGNGSVPPVPPLPGGGNPWPKRIAVLGGLFMLILLAVFGIRYALTSTSVATKDVELSYWGLWEDDNIIKPIIADFEAKNPHIKVAYHKESQKQYRARLQSYINQGQGPDIFRFHNTWVSMLHDDLASVPATVMTPAEFSSTFYPVAARDLVAGQTIYGIPLMYEGLGLFYNTDLFASAGITSPPTTWEELLSMVPKIAKPEGNTFVVSAVALGTTSNVEHFSDILATMFLQNGATITNLTGKEAEETLVFYRKFSDPSDPYYTWNDTMDNSLNAFANGKVAMIFAPSWRVFDLKQMNPALNFKVAALPQLPGNTVTWASYWAEGVSSKSKHQAEAWQFVKYLSSRDVMTKLYSLEAQSRQYFGEPYSRQDLASSIQSDPYAGAFITMAPNARSFPLASRTHDEGLNDQLIKYLENAVNSVTSGTAPSAALTTMSQGFRQVLSSYGLVTGSASTTATQ